MDFVARWPYLCLSIGSGASHECWAEGLQRFIATYNVILEWDETEQRMLFPASITCVIYSNLACCYSDADVYVGWTTEAVAALMRLAELMRHFRAPVYICSAESERWNLDADFDADVASTHNILSAYPNIIVCSGRFLERG